MGFDPGPFHSGLYNPRRPPTPEIFTLDVKVEIESFRMELLLSKPPPLQCDLPSRTKYVDFQIRPLETRFINTYISPRTLPIGELLKLLSYFGMIRRNYIMLDEYAILNKNGKDARHYMHQMWILSC